MGQCYDVEARFKFKNDDPSEFCKVFKKEVRKRNGLSANFELGDLSLNNPFDCFCGLTARDAHTIGDCWYAAFDASYSWEMVMYEVFTELLKVLDEGSFVRIWSDSGMTEFYVKDGQIIIE